MYFFQDYFDIIKEPIDLSIIDMKLINGEYKDPWEVRIIITTVSIIYCVHVSDINILLHVDYGACALLNENYCMLIVQVHYLICFLVSSVMT